MPTIIKLFEQFGCATFWHQKMDFDYCGDFSLWLYAFAFSNAVLLDAVDDTMRPIDRIDQGKMLKMPPMLHTANRICVWNNQHFCLFVCCCCYFGMLNRLSIELNFCSCNITSSEVFQWLVLEILTSKLCPIHFQPPLIPPQIRVSF